MGDVSVQFLGSGDAFGSGGRLQACIYVRTDATSFLIDCGTTALLSMRRFGVDPSSVDAILLSHLHGDHFGGLPFFFLDAQFISRRTNPLIVAGPPGLEARVHQAMEVLFPGSSGTRQQFDIDYVELADESTTAVASISVTPYTVLHESGAPAYALRVDCGGKVIAYSGDTGWTDSLTRAADGADLFVCETSFFDKKVPFHVDYETLMEHRAGLGCRRLILTHMSDDMLSRPQDVDAETAEDGMRIVV
jgi:ribonuclease BN (tRNA processing enzyme)